MTFFNPQSNEQHNNLPIKKASSILINIQNLNSLLIVAFKLFLRLPKHNSIVWQVVISDQHSFIASHSKLYSLELAA